MDVNGSQLGLIYRGHSSMRAVARVMMAQKTGGSLINIASTAGVYGSASMAPYGAAKAGVINLTKTMAKEEDDHE